MGSHAFFSYENMLGYSFKGSDLRTSDIDLVPDTGIMLALPNKEESFKDKILNSSFGFFEVPKLNHKHPSTTFKSKKQDIRLDIITPMYGPTNTKPIYIKALDSYAEPVRFLDYLLDDVQQAAVIEGSGLIINVPHPARYALHKLVVCSRRPAADSNKRKKDARQCNMLIEILKDDDPASIEAAVLAAKEMPSKFLVEAGKSLPLLTLDNQKVLKAYLK
ncbi:MAG: nucleotidyltransferase domain-containing protein [Pseudomonadales bacterium]|nr:nucleotidyltransferase domain-containing protein [Pseudomonadales bacterium]